MVNQNFFHLGDDVNEEFRKVLLNNDFRYEFFGDLEEFVTDIINTLNISIEALAKSDPDLLKTDLGTLIEIIEDLEERTDKMEPKAETAKITKTHYLAIYDYFYEYFTGIISRLDGEQSEEGLHKTQVFIDLIKQHYIDWLNQFDKWIDEGQTNVAIEAMKESLDYYRPMVMEIGNIEPLDPFDLSMIFKFANYYLKPGGWLAWKILSLQHV